MDELRGTSGITNGDRTFASAAATTTSILAGAMAICTIRATMRLTTSSGSRSPAAASGQRRLLGVLQALAQHDLLRRFDYLSDGFRWWLHRHLIDLADQ